MCYAFDLLTSAPMTADLIADIMNKVSVKVPDGWTCWAYSNHDCQRHTSRWNLTPAAQKLMLSLMMCLRGSACIYQGEELGFTEADLSFEDLQDPYGIQFWPEFKGRDGCRTPMAWSPDNQHGGFSTATDTWLPVYDRHLHGAAATQENDPDAIVHHYRRAIAFRHAHSALTKGAMSHVIAHDNVVTFTRTHAGSEMFCAFNLSDTASAIDGPAGNWTPTGEEIDGANISGDGKIHLGPWRAYFALKAR